MTEFPSPLDILAQLSRYYKDEYELKLAVGHYRRIHRCKNFIIAANELLSRLR